MMPLPAQARTLDVPDSGVAIGERRPAAASMTAITSRGAK